MGPIFVKKKSLEVGTHFKEIWGGGRTVKSDVFEVENDKKWVPI